MTRFRDTRIPKTTQDDVWDEFCAAVAKMRTQDDLRRFFKDLLNRQERLMLVRRLQIAKLLEAGATYEEIVDVLGVGRPTIARVQRWLNFGRDGYKRVLKGTEKLDVKNLKSQYRTYYRGK